MSFLSLRRSMESPFCVAPVGCKKPAEAGLFNIKLVKQVFEGQQVALMTQPADDADSQIRKIRVMPERLPGMHVGKMHLDERNRHRRQRIAQCHAGMRVGRRIDDDGTDALITSRMNALDQGPFMIALERFQFNTSAFSHASQRHVDTREGNPAIMLRLTGAKQVQIRPMHYQNAGLFDRLGSSFSLRHSCKFAANSCKLSS